MAKTKRETDCPQLNLALVFGQKSGLPFYYRKLSGNIPDVSTVKNLLADFGSLGFEKVKRVMDRGFYRAANINDLIECIENPGYDLRVGEILSAQKKLYNDIGINPPA